MAMSWHLGPDSFRLDSDLKPPRVPNICQVTANHGDTILFLSWIPLQRFLFLSA
jgi:hypothetical protein